jgi:hypothetical protein
MSSITAIKSRFARLGKHLDHWQIPVRIAKTSLNKPTASNTRTNRLNPPPVIPDLSSFESDGVHNNVPNGHKDVLKDKTNIPGTGHNKNAAEENEGRNRVEKLPPSELLAKVEETLKENAEFTPRFAEVKRTGMPQHPYQQPNQPIAPEVTNVKPTPTNPLSVLPWVPEPVLFTRELGYKFPPGFINRGSFGSVFLVRHRSRGDLAALKIVKIGMGESSTLVREIAALTRIREECNRFVLRQPLGVGDVIWTSDSGHLHLLFVSAHPVVHFGVFFFDC